MIAVLGNSFEGSLKEQQKRARTAGKAREAEGKAEAHCIRIDRSVAGGSSCNANLRSKSGTGITYGGGSIDGRTESRGLTGIRIHDT
jgi:hypothetical protein